MGLIRYRLGELLERNTETNSNLEYGLSDVRGVLNSKGISDTTKADVENRDLSKFLVVRPGGFIFNHRVHDKLGLGYNTSNRVYIFTNDYVAFYIKPDIINKVLLPDYLYMWYLRTEFDRYMLFKTYGSATLFFNWDNMCELEIDLPSVDIQQKYVDVYNAMLSNQQSYEQGLDDLKLACDSTVEDLKRRFPSKTIGEYIERVDERNNDNLYNNVKNVSVTKEFSEVSSKVDKTNLTGYKLVKPRQISFVQTTHNEHVFCNALNNTEDIILVTSVNEVFECNEDKLLPEYLCIFFNRSEFDRYARFHSWGSARETFTWTDLKEVKIPIPPIEVQRSLADLFTVYRNRKLNNQYLKERIKSICPVLIKGSIEEAGKGA